MKIDEILLKPKLSRDDLIYLLGAEEVDKTKLFTHAAKVKAENVGNKVYFRGLIEFSNACRKNCLYCGIRNDNKWINRYSLSDQEIYDAAMFASDNGYGSLVLQSGELTSLAFTRRVEKLLSGIHKITNSRLRITLSCGEQETEVYKRWFNAGAQRYLLRIEASNQALYEKLHPYDHFYNNRINCLQDLKKAGFQVGTGVMIGLPFQTVEDLADDLLFMRQFDIDMIGMGPYLEHEDTPFYALRDQLLPKEERFQRSLKMIAILRILMKDVNIAATTALQAIDKIGREKAILVGANVIMPNITPGKYRDDYLLYQNKPCTAENPDDCTSCLEARIAVTGNKIALGEWGDSGHYRRRKKGVGSRE